MGISPACCPDTFFIGDSENLSGLMDVMTQLWEIKDPAIRAKADKAFAAVDTPEEDRLMGDFMIEISNRILNLG